MSTLGIGLIGLGRHGLRYARHLLEPSVPGAKLVAVCRRDAVAGAAFAAEHGLRFHQDYRDLIADPQVEAVAVVTPPTRNRSIGLEVVRACKPLLVEKPLSWTGADAWDLVKAAQAAGVPLMTAQTLRFDPVVAALKAQMGTVGPRRYLVLTNRLEPHPEAWTDPADYAGRGVLLEIGIHLLDLVRFLTAEEIAEVRCEMDPAEPGTPEVRALVSLRTSGGLPCLLDVARVSAGRVGRVEWVGADGQLVASWTSRELRRVFAGSKVDDQRIGEAPTIPAVLGAFARALQSGAPMPVTGLDGQRAVEAADACYESASSGRAVRLAGS